MEPTRGHVTAGGMDPELWAPSLQSWLPPETRRQCAPDRHLAQPSAPQKLLKLSFLPPRGPLAQCRLHVALSEGKSREHISGLPVRRG